ncbi:helix-turn-helix domain-containing protein [Mesorhizobium sp. B1-1-7]|uniref:MarR family transcriptional regulator n=1 Tax=Mesorhizobium sp. B1-1-7 TaxID=2589977 RepID=UPI00112E67D9|nr:helix-turn-helix domain-containing protein [Mesorhizobium sp. B1-1-7]TPN53992.1 MarR family transcriptional regulator [Mesorhizobium sp. B1-1-7]
MLTEVDGEEIGLWLTLAEIARRRGVSRAAISKRVKRLAAEGSIETKPGAGGTITVELAAFDLATNEQTPIDEGRAPPAVTQHSRRSPKPQGAAADKVKYEAALRRLDYEERIKNLVPIKQVEDAMVRAGEAIVRAIDLSNFAGDLLIAAREGEPAVRRKLREIKDRIQRQAADALVLLAKEGETQERAGGVEFDLGEIDQREDR